MSGLEENKKPISHLIRIHNQKEESINYNQERLLFPAPQHSSYQIIHIYLDEKYE